MSHIASHYMPFGGVGTFPTILQAFYNFQDYLVLASTTEDARLPRSAIKEQFLCPRIIIGWISL